MPLHKRKPFTLFEPPQDLGPRELVYQVRFTKEIFRDYQEYLNRVNLYRQRVWTCKVTGKSNLTYEEALVSENCAIQKVQQFPKELIAPALQMIQYSMLSLTDIVDTIHTKFQETLMEGIELHGKKEDSVCACKILEILNDGDALKYKVGWLDKGKHVTDSSVVDVDDLIRKRPPLSRIIIKAFIRESTSRSSPWVVHEKLAEMYDISRDPPKDLEDESLMENGHLRMAKRKRKVGGDIALETGCDESIKKSKKRKVQAVEHTVEPIRYPIDDLLVKPTSDDPVISDRPSLCRDFKVPMLCVGDLLMVWNFCSSFGRLLNLWPFSLEDFENAICHTDSDLSMIVESHSALLLLLIKDKGDYFMAIRNKKRKSKIKLANWAEYLSDFLEVKDKLELLDHMEAIKRGHYGLLDVNTKLLVFRELVEEVLLTDTFRYKLNECIEQHQALLASRREETKKNEEKQYLKGECDSEKNHMLIQENGNSDFHNLGNGSDLVKVSSDKGNHLHGNSGKKSNGQASNEGKNAWKVGKGFCMEKMKNMTCVDVSSKSKLIRKGKDKELQGRLLEKNERLAWEIEKLSIRCNSLGRDRNYNHYWYFRREGRLFVESSDAKQWGYYCTKEQLDALLGSLNPKGERERALKRQLEKSYDKISAALQRRSKDISQRYLAEEGVLRRSTRVRAQPRGKKAIAFLGYANKWREK